MDNPFYDKPRKYYPVNPVRKEVVEERPFCPWCEAELDAAYAFDYVETCKCGTWSISSSDGWKFRRHMRKDEQQLELKQEIEQLENKLERLKNAYGET